MLFSKIRINKKYDSLIEEGKKLRENGEIDKAIEKYNEAFSYKIMSYDYIVLGFMYIDVNNYPKAIDMFNKLISSNPDLPRIFTCFYGLGIVYYALENYDEALKNLELAIEKDCDIDDCYYIAATIYDNMGLSFDSEETQKAIKYYESALKINPDNLFSVINLGTIYEHNDKNEEALKYFLKTYEMDKEKLSNACYNLGVTYTKLKDIDNALKYYLEDASLDNPSKSTFFNLGLLYQTELNDYTNAKKYYLKSLEKDKDDFNTWYNLGCLYSLMKDFKNAYDCFQIIKYKKPEYVPGMEFDNDLVEFRKTDYYVNIKNKNI